MLETAEPGFTWRTYLDRFFRRMDALEKRQFLTSLQVTRTTVQRWRNGQSLPKARHVSGLLDLLPADSAREFLPLLLADPRTGPLLPPDLVPVTDLKHVIPSMRHLPENEIIGKSSKSGNLKDHCSSILVGCHPELEQEPLDLTIATEK